jgi:hypothetical protein
LVQRALSTGFRGIDMAYQPKHYDEPGVGQGVAAELRSGLVASAALGVWSIRASGR